MIEEGEERGPQKYEISERDECKSKGEPHPMILDQDTRHLRLDCFRAAFPRSPKPFCPSQLSMNTTSSYDYRYSYAKNGRRKVRSAF